MWNDHRLAEALSILTDTPAEGWYDCRIALQGPLILMTRSSARGERLFRVVRPLDETWEALVTRGLFTEAWLANSRRFHNHAKEARTHVGYPYPQSVKELLAFVWTDPEEHLRHEELLLEAARRLASWSPKRFWTTARPPDPPITWCSYEYRPHQAPSNVELDAIGWVDTVRLNLDMDLVRAAEGGLPAHEVYRPAGWWWRVRRDAFRNEKGPNPYAPMAELYDGPGVGVFAFGDRIVAAYERFPYGVVLSPRGKRLVTTSNVRSPSTP